MKLVWTDPSLDDLRSIRDFIAIDSEHHAYSFVDQILIAAERLEQFPRMGRVVPEEGIDSIRELIFRNYRIIYRIAPDRIEILAIVHGSRDLGSRENKPWEIQ